MRLDLLEGVRTLQWSGHHSSHASGITDTLNDSISARVSGHGPSGRSGWLSWTAAIASRVPPGATNPRTRAIAAARSWRGSD